MSRLYFTVIILLAAGVLAAGMAITAHSLEELGEKPVTVLAVNSESNHTRITLLGTDYDLRFYEFTNNPLSADFNLKRALLWCQDLAFVRTLELPNLP